MISLILDYKRGKLPYKRFQLSFPAHHKTLLKIDEDQSIITNKFNPLFWEEGTGWGGGGGVTIYCRDIDQTLANTRDYLSDVTGVI